MICLILGAWRKWAAVGIRAVALVPIPEVTSMTYQDAALKLTGRNTHRRKLANNTYLERHGDGSIAVRLHNTDVVTYLPNGDTILNSGGWKTPTTKDRINNYVPQYRISQSSGQWYVYSYASQGEVGLFADGMVIKANGDLEGIVTWKHLGWDRYLCLALGIVSIVVCGR